MQVIDVRFVGKSEPVLRKAAAEHDVQVNTIKLRRDGDGFTLYGTLIVSEGKRPES